jgi:hypothetical protein
MDDVFLLFGVEHALREFVVGEWHGGFSFMAMNEARRASDGRAAEP